MNKGTRTDMKRLTTLLAALALAALVAGPAFAQPTGVEDVAGIGGEQVLPRVVTPDEAPPSITAPPAAQQVTQAAPGQLAQTGLELSTGAALAGALVLLGGGFVLYARRKAAA
jgi:LPXTG-motif cell wall-anchored protein